MYIGRKVTQTATHTDLKLFTCTGCSWEGPAFVIGVGQGTGNSAYFLDNEGADRRAAAHADKAAARNADLTLSLARCPECGKRGAAATAKFWAKTTATIVGGMAFLGGIGGLLHALKGDRTALWIFGPLALLVGVGIGWMEIKKFTSVDGRVQFVE